MLSATAREASIDLKRLSKNQHFTEAEVANPVDLFVGTVSKGSEKAECLKHLQEILLTSDQLYLDLGETLLGHYDGLLRIEEKVEFIDDIKASLVNDIVLENLSEGN